MTINICSCPTDFWKEFLKSIKVKPEKEKNCSQIHQLKYIQKYFHSSDLLLFVLSMCTHKFCIAVLTITISQVVSENSFVTLHTFLFCQNFHKNCHSNVYRFVYILGTLESEANHLILMKKLNGRSSYIETIWPEKEVRHSKELYYFLKVTFSFEHTKSYFSSQFVLVPRFLSSLVSAHDSLSKPLLSY